MKKLFYSGTIPVLAALVLVGLGTGSLWADGDVIIPPVKNALVQKECSACHMLYAPGLLPARSWSAMTADLANHFGDNAELDAASTKAITDYLTANAADKASRTGKVLKGLDASVTPERIVDLPWWKRKHDKKNRTSPETLARNGAKFKGDCKACHKQAEDGYFDEP